MISPPKALLVLSTLLFSPPRALADARETTDATLRNEQLPASVDLRPQMKRWGLTPRWQGRRNTCSVFATTSALEFACSKQSNQGTRLSAEYLNWASNQIIGNRSDRGQFFRNLLRGFDKYGICPDEDMPYRKEFDPDAEPSPEVIASAEKLRDLGLKVHWINDWHRKPGLKDRHLREIKEVLAAGYPVAAGASHSRLLVGYIDDKDQPGGGTFRVLDSALARFTNVTYDFVKSNVNDVFWIEASKG